ncbi:MAG TPA: four helix bundle protein [Victivallales bacterium]|nr:four helix bundle protein [Victivallales bacterium]
MDNREFKLVLEKRTKAFAISVVKFCIYLRNLNIPNAIITQLLKAGTAIGSNYREANRAESKKDFIHKIGIVEKEASETEYWLEVISESNILEKNDSEQLIQLMKESKELLALFTSISKKTKKKFESS